MAAAGDEHEFVLESQRGNPQIVIGNRCPGSLELNEKARVLFRGLAAGEQQGNRRFRQGASEVEPDYDEVGCRRESPPGSPQGLRVVPRPPRMPPDVPRVAHPIAADQPAEWYRGRPSLPLVRIDLALRGNDLVKAGVRRPFPNQIGEVGPLLMAYGRDGQSIDQ